MVTPKMCPHLRILQQMGSASVSSILGYMFPRSSRLPKIFSPAVCRALASSTRGATLKETTLIAHLFSLGLEAPCRCC